jgi:hypothetical protein
MDVGGRWTSKIIFQRTRRLLPCDQKLRRKQSGKRWSAAKDRNLVKRGKVITHNRQMKGSHGVNPRRLRTQGGAHWAVPDNLARGANQIGVNRNRRMVALPHDGRLIHKEI